MHLGEALGELLRQRFEMALLMLLRCERIHLGEHLAERVEPAGEGIIAGQVQIGELIDAFQEAQNRYRLLIDAKGPNPVDRAHFILSEVRSTLEWLFDDGRIDESDAQLAALRAAYDGQSSQDDLAGALLEYAALARLHREQMQGLGAFDEALIDEALQVAEQLRERSAGPETPERPAAAEALELRNRLGHMLIERVQRVRAAARFVFRAHPALVKEVTSRYARVQRAAQRKQQADAANQEPQTPEPTPPRATEEEAPAAT